MRAMLSNTEQVLAYLAAVKAAREFINWSTNT